MSDDIELSRRVSRQARAEALMRDELLQEGFRLLDAAYVEAWRATPARDQEAREKLWQAVQVLPKVKDHLQKVMDQGKVAKKELDDLAGKTKRFGIV